MTKIQIIRKLKRALKREIDISCELDGELDGYYRKFGYPVEDDLQEIDTCNEFLGDLLSVKLTDLSDNLL